METSSKDLYQKIFILATGVAATNASLKVLDDLLKSTDGPIKVIGLVESFMQGRASDIGKLEAFRDMLKQGFSVSLSSKAASDLLSALEAAGLKSWVQLFAAAINLKAPYEAALNQKASLANELADLLDSGSKTAFYQGAAVYAASQTILESVSGTTASLDLAKSNAKAFVNALSAQGIRSAVVDGYIAGATVFVDADGDGLLDPGEWEGKSDAQGYFSLPGGTQGDKLVAFGGTDLLTKKAFSGVLSAPAGSTVVNPITTLIQGFLEAGGETANVSQSIASVTQAVGVPAGINPLSYDPLAVLAKADASAAEKALALSVQSTAIQVSNTIAQLSSVISSSGAGVSKLDAASAVTQALAGAIAQTSSAGSGAVIDLKSTSLLSSVLTEAATESKASAVVAQVGQIVQVTAASNNAAAKATSIADLAKAAVVAQDAVSVLSSGASTGNFTAAIIGFTGSRLDAAIAQAVPGQISDNVPAVSGTDGTGTGTGGTGTGGTGTGGTGNQGSTGVNFDVTLLDNVISFTGYSAGMITISLPGQPNGSTTFEYSGQSKSLAVSEGVAIRVSSSGGVFNVNGSDQEDQLFFQIPKDFSGVLSISGNLGAGKDYVSLAFDSTLTDFKFVATGQQQGGPVISSLQNAEAVVFQSDEAVSVVFSGSSNLTAFSELALSGGSFDFNALPPDALNSNVEIVLIG